MCMILCVAEVGGGGGRRVIYFCIVHNILYYAQYLTVQAVVLVIVKGFARARNPPGLSLNVSLLPPFEGVKWGNPPVGAVSTDAPNGLNKNLNLVSQVRGATLAQFSFCCTSSQQAGGPPLSHSPHCSPSRLRNSLKRTVNS